MAGKKIIASFLFSLLVVFFCNNLPYEVYTSYANGHYSQQSVIKGNSLTNSSASDLSFSKPIVKKDHVKVRYMGGECRFEPHSTPVVTKLQAFVIKIVSVPPYYFTCSYHPFLFKLRGPPSA